MSMMNNKPYQRHYDVDVYRQKLGCLLELEDHNNGALDNSPPLRSKKQLKTRQQTPYHSTNSKVKLGDVKPQILFTDSDSEDQADNVPSPTAMEYIKQNGKGSGNKFVSFAKPSHFKNKPLRRDCTPYEVSRNMFQCCRLEKQVLFPSRNTDEKHAESSEDTEYSSPELPNLFSPSLSELEESPKRKKTRKAQRNRYNHFETVEVDEMGFNDETQESSIMQNPVKKRKSTELVYLEDTKQPSAKRKNMKNGNGKISFSDMKAIELLCENKNYHTILSSKSNFLDEESSSVSGDINNCELDLSASVEYDDTDVDTCSFTNDDEETTDFQEDQDVSIDLRSETSEENMALKEEIVEEAEYFSFNNMLAIVLHSNSKLYFRGLMSVKVLQGAVEVLGYTLTDSSNWAEIYSPRGSSFLYFQTKSPSVVQTNVFNILSRFGMESETVTRLCQTLEPHSAVILCKTLAKPEIPFLEKYTSQHVFPKEEDHYLPQCTFKNTVESWNVLKVNTEWDTVAYSIKSTSRLFLCGGKSVGKSTMLKYLINKLLLTHSEIMVIDLDPGQPEFTVSGCISATVINEPVFGPNYTHLRKPSRCFFIPNINISYEPDVYVAAVKQLMLFCNSMPKMPTVINYMGFTRGLGVQIFSAAVAHVQPTCVVEIRSNSTSRNYKERISYELICERSKLLASDVNFIQEFPVYSLESMADDIEGWHLEPRQIREMCVLAYLGQNLPEDVLSLTDSRVPVYVINLSQIKLICDGKVVAPAVVNANLVALCSLSSSNSSYVCHGWGVVRAINPDTKELFLVTPVSPDELEQVNHLILGSVLLPPSLYMTSNNSRGLVPYVAQGLLTLLGQIPKRSYLQPNHKKD